MMGAHGAALPHWSRFALHMPKGDLSMDPRLFYIQYRVHYSNINTGLSEILILLRETSIIACSCHCLITIPAIHVDGFDFTGYELFCK